MVSEREDIWLFDEESPDCEFTLLSRKEGEDGHTTTELASGGLQELRDWVVARIQRGASGVTVVLNAVHGQVLAEDSGNDGGNVRR